MGPGATSGAETDPRRCRKCTNRLPAPIGPGRPALYCSTACRRLVEYEIRRVNKQLELLTDVISQCHLGWNRRKAEDVPKYEAEVARLEAQIRVLIEEEV